MEAYCPFAEINKWMEKSNNFWNTYSCGNILVLPQTMKYRLNKMNIEILEIYGYLNLNQNTHPYGLGLA